MTKQVSDHGITLDDKSQEQPADKDRAQAVNETTPGKRPPKSRDKITKGVAGAD